MASAPIHPTPGRTNSGGFKTSDGTLYVSQPVRDKKSKKLRALITFAPRKSHFDTTNETSGTNEFRVSCRSEFCTYSDTDPPPLRVSSLFSGYPCSSSLSEPMSLLSKQPALHSILPLPPCSQEMLSLWPLATLFSFCPLGCVCRSQRP